MKREAWRRLHEVRIEPHPRTGKPRQVTHYIGRYYAVDTAARDRLRPWMLLEAVGAAALFLTGGLVNSLGSHSLWVLPFYALTLLPLMYLGLSLSRVARVGEQATEVDVAEGFQSLEHSALGLAVLGGLWAAAEGIFMLRAAAAVSWWRELLFLGCGLGCLAAGLLLYRQVRRIAPQTAENCMEKPKKQ